MFAPNELNIHRLILVSVMISSKFCDDLYFSNQYWAKIGGISNDEINALEVEMLTLLEYKLHLRRREYDTILSDMARCLKNDAMIQDRCGPMPLHEDVQLIQVSG